MNEYYQTLPKKRLGVGVLLFNAKGELLIVKPVYKDHWSVPGGVVDENESPRQACLREAKEEFNLELANLEFACVDYLPAGSERDESLQFLFDGGVLSDHQIETIQLAKNELSEYRFADKNEAISLLSERARRRLAECFKLLKKRRGVYLKNGGV